MLSFFVDAMLSIRSKNCTSFTVYVLKADEVFQRESKGVFAALCGLGALAGYAFGKRQAALGVGGDDIEGKLKGIIAEQLGVDADKAPNVQ